MDHNSSLKVTSSGKSETSFPSTQNERKRTRHTLCYAIAAYFYRPRAHCPCFFISNFSHSLYHAGIFYTIEAPAFLYFGGLFFEAKLLTALASRTRYRVSFIRNEDHDARRITIFPFFPFLSTYCENTRLTPRKSYKCVMYGYAVAVRTGINLVSMKICLPANSNVILLAKVYQATKSSTESREKVY